MWDPFNLLDVYRDPLSHPYLLLLWMLASAVLTGFVLYSKEWPSAINPLRRMVKSGEIREEDTRLFYRAYFPFRLSPEYKKANEDAHRHYWAMGYEIHPTTGELLGETPARRRAARATQTA